MFYNSNRTYHDIPIEFLGLRVEGLIPGSNCNFFSTKQIQDFNLQRPETPAPVFAILVWLLWVVHGTHVPRISAVHSHFHTCHFLSSTCTLFIISVRNKNQITRARIILEPHSYTNMHVQFMRTKVNRQLDMLHTWKQKSFLFVFLQLIFLRFLWFFFFFVILFKVKMQNFHTPQSYICCSLLSFCHL